MKFVRICNPFLWLLLLLASCNSSPDDASKQNKTFIDKGSIRIVCDSTFGSVMLQQSEIFEHLYDSAFVNWDFVSSTQVMDTLKYGNANIVVIGRNLDLETDSLMAKKNQSYARQHIIAWDAIALIVHPQSEIKDSFLTSDNIRFILSEKNNGTYTPVFTSSNVDMLKLIYPAIQKSRNNYMARSEKEVIEFVSTHPRSIGFIPYNSVSDSENEQTADILRKVKILSLHVTDSVLGVLYPSASQEDISTQVYPLIRPLNIVLTHTRDRLAVGFVQFLFQHQASRIFLKKGLVPRYFPEREVAIDTGSLIP